MTAPKFPIDLLRADLSTIVQALDSGVFTSVQLVQEYISRINANNVQGLGLRAISQLVNETECLAAARIADNTRSKGRKGLLHGIPVLVKESMGTGPSLGLLTTSGSLALVNSIPRKHAPVVQSLLDAGMIILGKSNMTVLGNHYQPGIPNGWSPYGGQVISPFGKGLETGGSSTGSAVALAAGLTAAAIGAESFGSITSPAHHNALWGLKPTPGSSSNEGVTPPDPELDSMGTFGKSVNDVACILDVLIPGRAFQSNLAKGQPTLAIGVSSERVSAITEEEEALFSEVQDCLSDIIVAKDLRVPLHQKAKDDNCGAVLVNHALKDAWDKYFENVDGPIRSLQDIVDWHTQHPSESFHPDHPGQLALMDALKLISSSTLAETEATINQLKANFLNVMDSGGLDAMIYPWAGWAPLLAGLAKLPICTAPYKLKMNGAPFGIMIIARPGAEATLLQVMAKCEQVFPPRPVPSLLSE